MCKIYFICYAAPSVCNAIWKSGIAPRSRAEGEVRKQHRKERGGNISICLRNLQGETCCKSLKNILEFQDYLKGFLASDLLFAVNFVIQTSLP